MAEGSFFPWKVKKLLSVVPDVVKSPKEGTRSPERSASATATPVSPLAGEPDLVPEAKEQRPVIQIPNDVIEEPSAIGPESDWELLSEKAANCSVGGEIYVARAGSVRSITSIDQENTSLTTLSVPFKIPRTGSSSTLDSQDNALGPSGKGVLGVDYVEHVVLPTDTLQGVCLAYKVSASSLRRANHFSGNSLQLAPKKLLIPLSKKALRTGFIRVQDTDTKEYKLHFFQTEFPDMSLTEAKAYLELGDWDLKEALQSAKEDREWEKEEGGTEGLKSGQISVKINFRGGKPLLNLKGIGFPVRKIAEEVVEPASEKLNNIPREKTVVHANLPSNATKSVSSEDLFNAAPQHNSVGFELKPLPKREQTDVAE